MPRLARLDGPGTWHHVMNRGVARRTLFETDRDVRFFLSRLAWEVHAGRLEVHAFCILTTHFHLLVSSTTGELSGVMQRVQNEYARWFNRGRRRDGPLFRGRFQSRPVETLAYRELLVRYIDANAVEAGLVATPAQYPHGSARWYAKDRGPIWMERSWVEDVVRGLERARVYSPSGYVRVFGTAIEPHRLRLVERRLEHSGRGEDPLDQLLNAAPDRVLEWMRRKAELADGTSVGLPVCDAADVRTVLDAARARTGAWTVIPAGIRLDAWPMVHVALLRDLCGTTLGAAAAHAGRTPSGAWALEARHRELLRTDSTYAQRVAELARAALDRVRCQSLFFEARCTAARSSPPPPEEEGAGPGRSSTP